MRNSETSSVLPSVAGDPFGKVVSNFWPREKVLKSQSRIANTKIKLGEDMVN